MKERKHYLDNIRWITVVLVIIYHIFYVFNCSGVVGPFNIPGVKALDSFCVFVYPWFMCLLFVVAGISMKYSLEKRTNKEFVKDRAKRLLVPSIVGAILFTWIVGYIGAKYGSGFGEAYIPGPIKFMIYVLSGSGPLWFARALFIISLVLVLIRKIDKKDKLSELGKKVEPWMLIPMFLIVCGSSFILNMPLITVYRMGIYTLMTLLGYYVFSNEELIIKMEKLAIPLIVSTIIVGIIYTYRHFGLMYADNSILSTFATNAYLWLAVISIFVFAKKYLNFTNKFFDYMNKNNFGFYAYHLMFIVVFGYIYLEYINYTYFWPIYVFMTIGTIICLPLFVFVLSKIPVLNTLCLGMKKSEKSNNINV